jgi:hypothetical protein
MRDVLLENLEYRIRGKDFGAESVFDEPREPCVIRSVDVRE